MPDKTFSAAGQEELVIEAGRGSSHYWRDLWMYRDLLGFLTVRDIKVRYKQTVLGIGWALIQPVVTTFIFTFVFGKLAAMSAGGVPYPLLVLAGLLPWQLFSSALAGSSASLISNANLISKVYFPRLVIPLSSMGVALLDFLVVLALYLISSVWFGRIPSWHWALLPLFILAALFLAFGAGLWFTALTVKYRDFRYIVPFLVQVGVFISPIGFSTSVVPKWKGLLNMNPMTGVIDAFRWCLLSDGQPFETQGMLCSVLMSTVLTLTGLWYFRKMEKTFADVI
ncbi:MAG TPA: ABC transporter permease [Opitutaceae bacterium]|jgi:lipopolysaccharide transport system permease protein|nr:ABC transporter permease [Opitutaceae bacterium]